jgi:glycosyltransferase involved in cell wall biosynthesis
MTPIALVQPEPGELTSGGYVYNRRLSEHVPNVVCWSVPLAAPHVSLSALEAGDQRLVLCDSLFLSRAGMDPFLELRARSRVPLGVVLHAFPSCVARAAEPSAFRPMSGSEPGAEPRPSAEELELVRALDVVVSPGRRVAALLAQLSAGTPCIVCPPGVDPASAVADEARIGSSVRLVALANVTPVKGLGDALQALAPLRDHAWELVVLGSLTVDRSHAESLARLATELGLDGRVRFAGALPHEAALSELAASDALLLTSRSENHPLSVLEALARGVPVLGYAVGDVPWVAEHDRSALLAAPGDVAALRLLVERFLKDRALQAKLGAGARLRGATLPTWQERAAEFQRSLSGCALLAAYEK